MNEQQTSSGTGLTEYLEGYQQLELASMENNLRKTRNAILVVAALTALGGFILYSMKSAAKEDLWLNLFLSAAYLALAFLTKKIPLVAVVVALVLFVGTWILNIVVGGLAQVFQGIIVKAVIIYYLIKGIGYAREVEALRQKIASGK